MGVAVHLRQQSYGTEIYRHFLQNVVASTFRPRFITLEVWCDNPAYNIYRKWGYEELSRQTERDHRFNKRRIAVMVQDLFTASISAE